MIIQQTQSRLKLLVVDDHTLFSEGTVGLLSSETGIEIVGVAKDGNECSTLVKTKKPGIILLALNLPDVFGIDLVPEIKRVHSEARIIILTGHNPESYIRIALKNGVQGFLSKDCTKKELIEAIYHVSKGKVYFSQGMAAYLKRVIVGEKLRPEEQFLMPDENKLLTPRETEIMNLILQGLNNQEISSTLNIKIRTINFHVSNILNKFGVNSRLKAIVAYEKYCQEIVKITRAEH